MICPICYNDIKKDGLTISNCFHKFHRNCIYKWIKYKENCPICRNTEIFYKYNKFTYEKHRDINTGYKFTIFFNKEGNPISSIPLWINNS
jgi:hypothetical protein